MVGRARPRDDQPHELAHRRRVHAREVADAVKEANRQQRAERGGRHARRRAEAAAPDERGDGGAHEQLRGGDCQWQGERDVRLLVLHRVDDRERVPQTKVEGDARSVPRGDRAEVDRLAVIHERVHLVAALKAVFRVARIAKAPHAAGRQLAAVILSKVTPLKRGERRWIGDRGSGRGHSRGRDTVPHRHAEERKGCHSAVYRRRHVRCRRNGELTQTSRVVLSSEISMSMSMSM